MIIEQHKKEKVQINFQYIVLLCESRNIKDINTSHNNLIRIQLKKTIKILIDLITLK